VIDKLEHLLDAKDANGWTPLHEGARAGHEDVVKLLVDRGGFELLNIFRCFNSLNN